MKYTYEELSKMIDHSLLNPVLDEKALVKGIETAIAYDTASVCIMPFFVKQASEMLKGSSVKATTTIGFPHGANTEKLKLAEAEQAIDDGAVELDMVVNISRVLSGRWELVEKEIREITEFVHSGKALLKVIFENCYLNEEQKIRLCRICSDAGSDWVKTSTGYGTGGAVLEDILLMHRYSAPSVRIKAAGGVRTLEKLLEVREAGCSRAGATATSVILEKARKNLGLSPVSSNTDTDFRISGY